MPNTLTMKYARSTLAAVVAVALLAALLHRQHRRARTDHTVTAPAAPVVGGETPEDKPATAAGAATSSAVAREQSPRASVSAPAAVSAIPPGRFRDVLSRLTAPARRRALAKLAKVHPPREDYASLHISPEGGVFYVCNLPPGQAPVAGAAAVAGAPAAASTAGTAVPLAGVPARHSRPGSANVLYLDFGGMTITGTAWNNDTGAAATYVAKPYDTDGDATTFSDAEQSVILEVWARVAEDYSPFDIDVTTERPAAFTRRTAHALITSRTDANGVAMPYNTSGGIAYVEAFNDPEFVTYYSPALIYFDNIGGTRADHIGEATAHELGHNLGLSHDGQTNGTEYYAGHDANTSLSWAPIMGAGYDKNITQWSKGEYYLANNTEDDVAIIAAHTGYTTDEAGGTTGSATALTVTDNTVSASGVIGSSTDADVYSVTTTGGAVGFEVQGYVAPTQTHGGDTDLKLELLDRDGNVLTSSNPAGSTDASVSAILAAGTYYVRISPVGVGTPTASPPNGYTSYGSIGQYNLTGTVQVAVTQTITFPAIAAHVYGDAPFALGATSSSGLTVSYTVASGPATVSGSTLTITGAGDVTIRASQPGNGSYAAAPSIDRSFTVAKATLTATADDQTRNYGQPNPTLTIRYAGFVNGDDVSVLTSTPTAATTATTSSAAGGYPITLTGGGAANYALTLVNGTLTVVGADAAPTIGSIVDQTILQGTSTGALGFTIGDDWTAPAGLAVSAHSSNQALVPDAAIVLGGSGANRTVTITPVGAASGRATITLSVSDGTLTTSTSFVVQVAAVNDAPTISGIGNQTIAEDGATGALPFTVADQETAASNLAVTATSSNRTLVPESSILLGGSGASRTVMLMPVAGATGSAMITLTVSDGSLTASTSFALAVEPAPVAPTITSGASTTFTIGVPCEFTVTAMGTPEPAFSATGLPAWLTLDSATGRLSGTAPVGTGGMQLNLLITASNDSAIDATQVFTLDVQAPPAITAPLIISTVAGQAGASGHTDATGTSARFNQPTGVAIDDAGNIYLADTDNNVIRKVTAAGVVTTVAGQVGTAGRADGMGSAARFNAPSGVAVDAAGNLYVADTLNHSIRKITAAGVVSTLAGQSGFSGRTDGVGAEARFFGPQGLALDASLANLYVADTNNHTIRRIVLATAVGSTLAGGAGEPGAVDATGVAARFNAPSAIAVDKNGTVYVADTENNAIRTIATGGAVDTLAGLPGSSGAYDGIGGAARFSHPAAIAVGSAQDIYVLDTDDHTIRKVGASTGAVSTLAGLAGTSGSADGTGDAARFTHPAGLASSSAGDLYVADTGNHTLRLGQQPVGPSIRTQPQSQTVTAGVSVQFSVVASGVPAPTYQWQLDGAAISGATSDSYSIASPQAAAAGDYTVVVSNAFGSVTSAKAVLSVSATSSSSSPTVDSNAGGGGGGGAPGMAFHLGLALLLTARWLKRRN